MTDLKTLELKVNELEERLKRLENKIAHQSYTYDKDLMDAFYMKARELVVKHNKASIFFLQRKLLIDFERATKILEELEANGIIGPAVGLKPRKILVKKIY